MYDWARNALIGSAVIVTVAGTASVTQAAPILFDFAAIVAGVGEQGANGQGAIGTVGSITVSSPATTRTFVFAHTSGLVATASASLGTSAIFPYLDAVSGGPAGLGACQVLTPGSRPTGLQCSPSSDDNVTSGENLQLSFTVNGLPVAVLLNPVTYRDGNHTTTFRGTVEVFANNASLGSFPLSAGSPTGFVGDTFVWHNNNTLTEDPYQFYINTTAAQVPEPATLACLAPACSAWA